MGFNPDEPRGKGGKWTHLAGLMKAEGGFTHVVGTGETNPSKGIAVGIPSPDGKDWQRLEHGKTTPEDIRQFVNAHKDELSQPGRAVGGWSNGDPAEGDVRDALDIVQVANSPEEAYGLAKKGNQDGVFDLGKGEYVSTEDLGKKVKVPAMSLSFITPNIANPTIDLAAEDGKLAFWKQILPLKSIDYTAKDGSRQKIDFTKEYLTDLASNKAVDKIGFLLADKDNAHTMDPERWRGDVTAMEVREDGLYGKIVFPSAEAAKAVLENPELGVSARIREGVQRSDGSTVNRGIIHVLGTLDPQVSGMSPWQTADLSIEGDYLDLSDKEYSDMADKPSEKALADYTEADIDKMTDEELDKFLAEFVPEFDAYNGDEPTDEADEDESEDDHEDEDEDDKALVGAGADMSAKVSQDIELANQQVASANARASEALRRVAEAEWREERGTYLSDGVPPHALDLAAPVLNRADDMVIDLSNADEADVNVSQVVRGLLDALKGTVDLSNEAGHNGTFTNGEDPDREMLDLWSEQF